MVRSHLGQVHAKPRALRHRRRYLDVRRAIEHHWSKLRITGVRNLKWYVFTLLRDSEKFLPKSFCFFNHKKVHLGLIEVYQ